MANPILPEDNDPQAIAQLLSTGAAPASMPVPFTPQALGAPQGPTPAPQTVQSQTGLQGLPPMAPPVPQPMSPLPGTVNGKRLTPEDVALVQQMMAQKGALPASQMTANGSPQPAPGAANGNLPNPNDAALSALLTPRAAPAPHATALDRQYLAGLNDQAKDAARVIDQGVAATQQHAADMQQNTEALADDSWVAAQVYKQQQQEEAKSRNRIMQDHQQSQSRLNAQLDQLQAQGINPNQYFQNQTTASNISQAVLVGLTQFGQGVAHRQGNPALEMINDAVARDVDAQKTNLQKNLQVMGKRLDLDNTNFDQQNALLKAEAESYQAAYTVASNDVSKRAAMYQGNAEVQQKATDMQSQLELEKNNRVGQIADKQYALQKRYDVQGRAGGIAAADRAAIIKRMADIRDKGAENGKPISVAEARRQAVEEHLGFDANPGTPEASYAKTPKGGVQQAQAEQLGHIDGILSDVQQLQALRKQHGGGAMFAPEDDARATALARHAQAELGKAEGGRFTETEIKALQAMVPDDPLATKAAGLVGSDPIGAKLQQVLQIMQQKKQYLQANPQAASADTDNSNPLNFDEAK